MDQAMNEEESELNSHSVFYFLIVFEFNFASNTMTMRAQQTESLKMSVVHFLNRLKT